MFDRRKSNKNNSRFRVPILSKKYKKDDNTLPKVLGVGALGAAGLAALALTKKKVNVKSHVTMRNGAPVLVKGYNSNRNVVSDVSGFLKSEKDLLDNTIKINKAAVAEGYRKQVKPTVDSIKEVADGVKRTAESAKKKADSTAKKVEQALPQPVKDVAVYLDNKVFDVQKKAEEKIKQKAIEIKDSVVDNIKDRKENIKEAWEEGIAKRKAKQSEWDVKRGKRLDKDKKPEELEIDRKNRIERKVVDEVFDKYGKLIDPTKDKYAERIPRSEAIKAPIERAKQDIEKLKTETEKYIITPLSQGAEGVASRVKNMLDSARWQAAANAKAIQQSALGDTYNRYTILNSKTVNNVVPEGAVPLPDLKPKSKPNPENIPPVPEIPNTQIIEPDNTFIPDDIADPWEGVVAEQKPKTTRKRSTKPKPETQTSTTPEKPARRKRRTKAEIEAERLAKQQQQQQQKQTPNKPRTTRTRKPKQDPNTQP